MKKLGYLFMMCLLVAFTSCNSSMDESLDLQNYQSYIDLNQYKIDNFTYDIYDYISKDSLDKYQPFISRYIDSVKIQRKGDLLFKKVDLTANRIATKAMIDEYTYYVDNYANMFSVSITYAGSLENGHCWLYQFDVNVKPEEYGISCNLKWEDFSYTAYYDPCLSFSPNEPCREGIAVNFLFTGIIDGYFDLGSQVPRRYSFRIIIAGFLPTSAYMHVEIID